MPNADQVHRPIWKASRLGFTFYEHIQALTVFSIIRLNTMSLRLPPPTAASDPISGSESNSSSESEDDNEETWDDWVSDSNTQQNCKSLFDEKVFPSANEALEHDKNTHQFDLDDVCKSLCEYTIAIYATFYSSGA